MRSLPPADRPAHSGYPGGIPPSSDAAGVKRLAQALEILMPEEVREIRDRMRDRLLYGVEIIGPDGRRVDPADVLPVRVFRGGLGHGRRQISRAIAERVCNTTRGA